MDSSFTTQVPVQISIRPQDLSTDVVDSPRNLVGFVVIEIVFYIHNSLSGKEWKSWKIVAQS